MQTEYRRMIGPMALKHGLDPYLVEGLIWVESRGVASAYRFESKFWERYLAKQEKFKGQIPRRVSASYGLMQVMYTTALDHGFIGEPEALFIPVTNLRWGCTILARLFKWAELFPVPDDVQLRAVLASYNGGKGGNKPGEPLRPECAQYAEKVLAATAEMREP